MERVLEGASLAGCAMLLAAFVAEQMAWTTLGALSRAWLNSVGALLLSLHLGWIGQYGPCLLNLCWLSVGVRTLVRLHRPRIYWFDDTGKPPPQVARALKRLRDTETAECTQLLKPLGETIRTLEASSGRDFVFINHLKSGQRVPRHAHYATDQLEIITAGRVTCLVGTEQRTLSHGQFVFIPRGTPHAFIAEGNAEMTSWTSGLSLEQFFSVYDGVRPYDQLGRAQRRRLEHDLWRLARTRLLDSRVRVVQSREVHMDESQRARR